MTVRSDELIREVATFGDLSLNLFTHELSCGARTTHLSGKEFELICTLMASTTRVLSKHDLLIQVWGTDSAASENSVEAYISFLRKKISQLHSHVHITTLRMLGYRLEYFDANV
jgi:DNA-binding response OmpR family regulator